MATWSGGQRLVAARLVDVSGLVDLPISDTVPSSFSQWGNTISFTNPGVDVAVCAWLVGRAYTSGSSKLTLMYRIDVSHDNGVNWSNGTEQWVTVEPSSVSGTDQKNLTAIHRAQGLPTGTVRVRAMIQSAGGTGIALRSGQLMATMTAV